jgi:acetylornithine deacetylase
MRELALPYPVSVGRLAAGEWSSSVPDRLVFEGRVGVRVGEELPAARAALEAAVRAADDEDPPVEIAWTGGAFAPGETDPAHPWVGRVRAAVAAERGDARIAGVPWGADMRLFTARGIPAVMLGT